MLQENYFYRVFGRGTLFNTMKKSSYAIGIVTYHARFESYFIPLIENLTRIFPDKEILCVINGHSDKTLQIAYLDRVTRFMKKYPNVRYLTYDVGQSLSKCWNQLIILSHAHKTVILSDDVFIGDYFRDQLEKHIESYEFFAINRSFAHFVISKEVIKKVGWFDERLPRIGWEDTDYQFRLLMEGVEYPNVKVLGSLNLHTDTEGSDWVNDPSRPKTKYTYANEDFFKTKWQTKHYNPEIKTFAYNGGDDYHTFTPVPGMETPLFYDLSVLAFEEEAQEKDSSLYQKNTVRYFVQKILFTISDTIFTSLRKLKRFLKKIKETHHPI